MAIWCICWYIGIFAPVLVSITEKSGNPAIKYANIKNGSDFAVRPIEIVKFLNFEV
jgi:hypothetical protein